MNENVYHHDMHHDMHHDGEELSQSGSIDSIRDRIAAVQGHELDTHVTEYDAIHDQLQRALTAIDGI
jgi:hypothetical protein